MSDTAGNSFERCEHCGNMHSGQCPRIRAIEYHPNGVIKRVEYHGPEPPDAELLEVTDAPMDGETARWLGTI